jgi:hypothetical protein
MDMGLNGILGLVPDYVMLKYVFCRFQTKTAREGPRSARQESG